MKDEGGAQKKRTPLRRIAVRILAGLTLFLSLEALMLPPAGQPSARLLVGAIHVYQAVASPLLGKVVHCKFEPTCSHYGEQSIAKYGTLRGTLCTLGRIWRCSPWGPPPGRDLP